MLDNDERDNDTNDTHIIKHSPFFNKNQSHEFTLTQWFVNIRLNVCNTFIKCDELALFIHRVNINNPISVICPNESWHSVQSFLTLIQHPTVLHLFVEISMLIYWKFLPTRILSLLFPKVFSPRLPYQPTSFI